MRSTKMDSSGPNFEGFMILDWYWSQSTLTIPPLSTTISLTPYGAAKVNARFFIFLIV